jgi:hypothetical protein
MEEVNEALEKESERAKELAQNSDPKAQENLLKQAKEGLADVHRVIERLNLLLANLRMEVREQGLESQVDVAEAERRFADLVRHQEKLIAYAKQLEAILKDLKDPKYARWTDMINRAHLLEEQAEFDQAIQLYEEVIREMLKDGGKVPQLAEYTAYLDKLKQSWQTKSDAHREARRFIYDTWSKVETGAQLKNNIAQARKALQVCRDAGDPKTPLRLMRANTVHANRLTKQLDELRKGQETLESREETKTLLAVRDDLEKLTQEAGRIVQPAAGAKCWCGVSRVRRNSWGLAR